MEPAYFIDPSGQVVAVPAADVARVRGYSNWTPASVEQIRDHLLQQKYGSGWQQAIAGLEAAGSALTLGASTWGERAAGVPGEDIAGRAEANPVSSGVGTGVGILAPLLLSGGASAAVEGAGAASTTARAASMAGPSLLAKAGQATAKAALRSLPEDAPLLSRLAAKGAAAAAGGAVEGAGYEAGQLVHESALGDPNLTAESALARVGLSAATFGALSGAGGVLGVLAHEAVGSAGAGGLGAKLADWLGEFEGERNIKAAGGIQSDLARARKQVGREGLASIGREMGEMGLVTPLSTPGQTLERADALMGTSGATMGEVLKSADEVARAEGTTLGDVQGVVKRARGEVLEPLAKDPFQREAAGKLSSLLDEIGTKGDGATLEDLHQLRRQGDAALYGMRGTQDPYATAYRQALHDLRGIISDGLEAGVEKSGLPLDVWKTANREYQVAARASEFAEKGLDRAHGNNFVSPTELLSGLVGGAATGPLGGLAGGLATAAVRRHGSGTLGWMARGLRGLLEGEEGAALANGTASAIAAERRASFAVPGGAVVGARLGRADAVMPSGINIAARASAAPETAAALAVLAKAKSEVTKEVDSALSRLLSAAPGAVARASAYAGAAEAAVSVRRLAASPELLQDALTRQTDELHGHAPGVAQAAQVATARAIAFLASKAPTHGAKGLSGRGAQVSMTELGKFARYAEVVHRPLSVLAHAQRGTLTPQHVAALRLVYPALYGHVQERLLWNLAGHGSRAVNARSRMMLSILTGFQLDASMEQAAIAANQGAFAGEANRSIMDQSRTVPNPNAEKLNTAHRTMSAAQALDSRLNGGK